MNQKYITIAIVLVIGYFIGVKFPMFAQKLGIA